MLNLPDFAWPIVFVVALLMLLKSSDWFIESAEKLGKTLGIPAFIIGLTVIAFGTSLPELVSSLVAVFKGSSEIVVGNVVGSNISNLLLIIGITAMVGKSISTTYDIGKVDLPMLAGSAFLLFLMLIDGKFSIGDTIVCLLGLGVYLAYVFSTEREEDTEGNQGKENIPKLLGLLALSGVAIYFAATFTVDSIIEIARMLKIGEEIVAVTAVALGTSLPELVVCLSAVKSGNSEMAIGNVIGSNIFNTFCVMGIPSLFGTLVVPGSIITLSLPIMLFATLLFIFMLQDKKIDRWEGGLLLLFYVLFVTTIIESML